MQPELDIDIDVEIETDTGPGGKRGRERRCIVTRQTLAEDALIRFVAHPDGNVVPDLKARLPGRGAWVRADAETIGLAVRKGHFARALKTAARAKQDLVAVVGELLTARALDAMGLAMRQGAVVTGQTKVGDGVRKGRFKVVLFAADGAADSRRKLEAALQAGPRPRPLLCDHYTSQQMSLAMGRANVVHAGVAGGRAAAALLTALRRRDAYFGGEAKVGLGVS